MISNDMINCFYDSFRVLSKVYSSGAYLKNAVNEEVFFEPTKSLAVKTIYGVLDCDKEFEYYIEKLCDKRPKTAIRTVLKIAMYHASKLGKKEYAVCDNAVALVKKMGKGGAAGFVNATLRKFFSVKIELPKNDRENLAIKYSYPEIIVGKLIKRYGIDEAENIMAVRGGKTTLVFYKTDGEKYLSDRNISYEKTPFTNVFTTENFIRNADYDSGVYTFQSIGSVAISEIVKGGKTLLDSCAAPGGKSVYLSRKFDEVFSQEIHPHRCELIKSYINRIGVKNVTVVNGDASVFNPDFKEKFDAVLCDVPCSSIGVAFENPDVKLKDFETSLKTLPKTQAEILINSLSYLKKGGTLYYSTCSLLKEENDDVIKKAIEKGGVMLEEITSPLAHIKTECGLQFLPNLSGGGFYVSALKKL